MADDVAIVMIPSMPAGMVLDFVFKTEVGVAVRASQEKISQLRAREIPVIELFRSGNEYAAAVMNCSKEEAIAVIDKVQNTALAQLTTDERDQFGIA